METIEDLILRVRLASHERIPGAPGTGKTGFLLAETAARLRRTLAHEGCEDDEAGPRSGAAARSHGSCPEESAAQPRDVEGAGKA
jgi:hypothetical protein